jgi:hypothetical protein
VARAAYLLALTFSVATMIAVTADAEVTESGNLIVNFDGGIAPERLPRSGTAPVSVRVSAAVSTTDGSRPPQLERITLDINRNGRISSAGLPTCRRHQLVDTTTRAALRACGPALVGLGHVSARIALPEQAPLPSEGTLLAFNSRRHGRPVILGQVYGAVPLPVTSIVPFRIGRAPHGFGTRLVASFPHIAADWGYVTDVRLRLGRRYSARGQSLSFLSAGCPAPRGLNSALFTLARADYTFDDGRQLASSLVRSCKVRR